MVGIDGYRIYRWDWIGWRGGGVALYVRSTLQSSVWTYSADDRQHELQWVRVGDVYVAAFYHPPRPIVSARDGPSQHKSLHGWDQSWLSDVTHYHCRRSKPASRSRHSAADWLYTTGSTADTKHQHTGLHLRLRATVQSSPRVKSVVRSDHRAIVAYAECSQGVIRKACYQLTYRKKTPTQHAMCLQHVAKMDLDSQQATMDPQSEFDQFYRKACELYNQFYPECTITTTSRDPEHITPELKSKLWWKNRLMQAGWVEEASALAQHIGKEL